MKRVTTKMIVFAWALLTCLSVLYPASKAFAFGNDIGEHCWTGVETGVFIKLQVTNLGNFYNINGAVSNISNSPGTYPAYGTAFFDKVAGVFKIGYTVAIGDPSGMYYNTVFISLDPVTLTGTKVVMFSGGSGSVTEAVTHIACQ